MNSYIIIFINCFNGQAKGSMKINEYISKWGVRAASKNGRYLGDLL